MTVVRLEMCGDPTGSTEEDGIVLSVSWEQCPVQAGSHFPPVFQAITR